MLELRPAPSSPGRCGRALRSCSCRDQRVIARQRAQLDVDLDAGHSRRRSSSAWRARARDAHVRAKERSWRAASSPESSAMAMISRWPIVSSTRRPAKSGPASSRSCQSGSTLRDAQDAAQRGLGARGRVAAASPHAPRGGADRASRSRCATAGWRSRTTRRAATGSREGSRSSAGLEVRLQVAVDPLDTALRLRVRRLAEDASRPPAARTTPHSPRSRCRRHRGGTPRGPTRSARAARRSTTRTASCPTARPALPC